MTEELRNLIDQCRFDEAAAILKKRLDEERLTIDALMREREICHFRVAKIQSALGMVDLTRLRYKDAATHFFEARKMCPDIYPEYIAQYLKDFQDAVKQTTASE